MSPTFFAVAVALALAMRALPTAAGRAAHLIASIATWGWLLAHPANWAAGALHVMLPYGVVMVLGATHRAVIPLLVVSQVAGLIVLRGSLDLVGGPNGDGLTLRVIGVSYITLRQFDWVLNQDPDAKRPSPLSRYLAYLLSPYGILAGPIARYDAFDASLLRDQQSPTPAQWLTWLHRVANGLLKISVLAPVLGELSSHGFVVQQEYSGPARLLSFYVYPVYIFINFAGYCDVVIGLAAMAGIDLPENFNRPFAATNVQDFWQRWHISLSTWLRDYVFFTSLHAVRRHAVWLPAPLSAAACTVALFVVVGLWHGLTPAYAIFGLSHGLAAAALLPYDRWLERVLSPGALDRYHQHPAWRALRVAVCFHFVCLTITLFDRSVSQAMEIVLGP